MNDDVNIALFFSVYCEYVYTLFEFCDYIKFLEIVFNYKNNFTFKTRLE